MVVEWFRDQPVILYRHANGIRSVFTASTLNLGSLWYPPAYMIHHIYSTGPTRAGREYP